jgi:hypothetical protein
VGEGDEAFLQDIILPLFGKLFQKRYFPDKENIYSLFMARCQHFCGKETKAEQRNVQDGKIFAIIIK